MSKGTSCGCWDLTELTLGFGRGNAYPGHMLLYGPSGTGKSRQAKTLGLAQGQEVYAVTLTQDMPMSELRGHYVIGQDREFRWQHGPCLLAWLNGGRLVIDELEKASGDAQSFLLAVLDDPAVASITLPTGETVRPAPGFSVIATSNAEADEDLEPALRDRFPVTIRIDRPHPGALSALPADVSHAARNSAGVDDPQRRVSVRSWSAFARLRDAFGDEALAAQAVFGARADDVLAALAVARTKAPARRSS
jgi:MoxR-like ATPase